MNLSHFVRTDWFYRIVYRFCFVVHGTTLQSAARIEQNTAFSWSYRLLVMAIGYWRLGMVYGLEHVALPLFMPLTFRLIAYSLPKAVF